MSVAILRPRLCELGKIKIGRKGAERTSQGGATYRQAEKLDHFLVTTLQRDAQDNFVVDELLMKQLAEEHGDDDGKLRQLPIAVLSNDIEDIIQAAYVAYNGRTCLARCEDGKTITRFVKDGKFLPKPVEEPWRDSFLDLKNSSGGPLWKKHTKFACVIASTKANWGGVYFLRTTSGITGDQLLGSLLHVQELTCGVLRGVPLRLVVRPMQVTPEGKPTTVYVIHAELAGTSLSEVQQLALERRRHELEYAKEMAATERQYRKLLKAPGLGEDGDEALDISTEFHPPTEESQEDPQSAIARDLGTSLGLSQAQVEVAIRKAGKEHIGSLLDDWGRQLKAKGGVVDDGAQMRKDMNQPMYREATQDERETMAEDARDEGNPIFDEMARETQDRATGPAQPATRPATGGSVSTGIWKHPLVAEAEQRKRDQEKEDKRKVKDEAAKQGRLVPPTDNPYAL